MFSKRRAYLDYASAAPVTYRAWWAFVRSARAFGNPSSPHEEGRKGEAVLEAARREIARLTEAKPDDVIFTSGATEANNLAIRGLVKPGSHVLYLASAHASVVESIRSLEGIVAELLPLRDTRVDISELEKRIRPATALICLDAVCGETGTIWNTREVRALLDKLKSKRPLLLVDASQAPLSQKLTRSHYGADLLVFDAQKVGGYRGAGVLIAPRTIPLTPIVFGGGQERGLRSGTPHGALAAAFATALTEAANGREAFSLRASRERAKLKARVLALAPDIYINEGAESAPNILNISFPGRDTDYLATLLDTAGVAVSTRSACETDSSEGSRAVYALTGDRARSLSTLRVSWGPSTGSGELRHFARELARALAFIDNTGKKSQY